MHNFKGGDRVRRIGTNFREILIGHEYTVAVDTGNLTVKLAGYTGSFTAERFELVTPAEPTDEELAAEFREAYEKMSKVRNAIIERGYTINFTGFNTPLKASALGKKFDIKKTVTTTKEI